ncbi:2490_t:CDS:2 [Funneliformis mosseae]|uniref:2490_t:CDS:1 n=1 Tax=Funneliformis mosseae TaxID=27381 RepID=A0A9N8W1I7_FUNMO|nr:2490_t:CDS:2 [Funneliformis mosseae]
MTSIFYPSLSRDLSCMLENSDDFNVTIKVGEKNNTKEFRAHTLILRARSQYFKVAFSSNWITKENDMILFNKPNINQNVFDMILKYIYAGELDLTNLSSEDILRLLITSDELLLEELIKPVQAYLIKNPHVWVQRNFVLIYHQSLINCKRLQDFCFEPICVVPEPFFNSKHFLSLDKDILFDLLKRDDLTIGEIDIWDCLVKWGIGQTPRLIENFNETEWNPKGLEVLEKTIEKFIPLIRFTGGVPYFITRPYKAAIPYGVYRRIDLICNNKIYKKETTLTPRSRTKSKNQFMVASQLTFHSLSRDLALLLKKSDECNVIILVGENQDAREFHNTPGLESENVDRNQWSQENIEAFEKTISQFIPLIRFVEISSEDFFDKVRPYKDFIPRNIYEEVAEFYFKNTLPKSTLTQPRSINTQFEIESNLIRPNLDTKVKISRVVDTSRAIVEHKHSGFNFGETFYMGDESIFLRYNGSYEANVVDSNRYTSFTPEEIEIFRLL